MYVVHCGTVFMFIINTDKNSGFGTILLGLELSMLIVNCECENDAHIINSKAIESGLNLKLDFRLQTIWNE